MGQIRGDGVIQEQVVELHAARRFLKTMQTPKRTFQIANDSPQAKKLVSIKFAFLSACQGSVPVGGVLTFLLQQ